METHTGNSKIPTPNTCGPCFSLLSHQRWNWKPRTFLTRAKCKKRKIYFLSVGLPILAHTWELQSYPKNWKMKKKKNYRSSKYIDESLMIFSFLYSSPSKGYPVVIQSVLVRGKRRDPPVTLLSSYLFLYCKIFDLCLNRFLYFIFGNQSVTHHEREG